MLKILQARLKQCVNCELSDVQDGFRKGKGTREIGRAHVWTPALFDGIPAELFKILKADAMTVLHSLCRQIWKTQQWPQDWKKSVFILIPKKGNAKECINYHTLSLISHGSKVMFKYHQARLQQCMNIELPDVQAGFRKGRGTRDQIANIRWIIEKARVPEKHLLLLYWLGQSLWLCVSQQTVENSERDGNTRPPDLPLEKPVCRSGSNS